MLIWCASSTYHNYVNLPHNYGDTETSAIDEAAVWTIASRYHESVVVGTLVCEWEGLRRPGSGCMSVETSWNASWALSNSTQNNTQWQTARDTTENNAFRHAIKSPSLDKNAVLLWNQCGFLDGAMILQRESRHTTVTAQNTFQTIKQLSCDMKAAYLISWK